MADEATLEERVAALETIVGEEEYELRYSGEEVDELLDDANYIFNSSSSYGKTKEQVRNLINRTYPLYISRGSYTLSVKVNADNGWQTHSGTISNAFSSDVSNPTVIAVCDFGGVTFDSQAFTYKVDGQKINWKIRIDHSSSQGGTYSFKIYYLVVGKNAEGGSIG